MALVALGGTDARAERWISTEIESGDEPICVDRDSIGADRAGYTHFSEMMCASTQSNLSRMQIAVDCDEVASAREFIQYMYDRYDDDWIPALTTDSTALAIARFVCRIAR